MQTQVTQQGIDEFAASGAKASDGAALAVLAGAAMAGGVSVSLLMLGVGAGWSSISPWSPATGPLSAVSIAWLVCIQLLASVAGAYVAGSVYGRGREAHDGVLCRDTTAGVLTWAVPSLTALAVLTGSMGTVLSGMLGFGVGRDAQAAASDFASQHAALMQIGYQVQQHTTDAVQQTAGGADVHTWLWMTVALVLGAVVASLASSFGGLLHEGMQVKRED